MENPITRKFWLTKLLSEMKRLNVTRGAIALRNALSETKCTDGKYIYFRLLDRFNYVFANHGFELIQNMKNADDIGGLYIFRKKGNAHADKPESIQSLSTIETTK